MQDEESLTPADRELASALGGLRPAHPSVDRDRMMFHAGQASARRRGRLWQSATAALALALGLSVIARPGPRQVDHIVYVAKEAPSPEGGRWTGQGFFSRQPGSLRVEGNYLKLRNEVLAHGLDALAMPDVPAGKSSTSSESLGPPAGAPRETPSWRSYRGDRALRELGEHL